MCDALKLTERLQSRDEVAAEELDFALETRSRMHRAGAPYSPVYPTIGRLFPGGYSACTCGALLRRVLPLNIAPFPLQLSRHILLEWNRCQV
jgi:hypothetical protein